MKYTVIIPLIFFLIVLVDISDGAQTRITLESGESASIEGKTLTLIRTESSSAVISVDGVQESIDEGYEETVNELKIKPDAVFNSNGTEGDTAVLIVTPATAETTCSGSLALQLESSFGNSPPSIKATGLADCSDKKIYFNALGPEPSSCPGYQPYSCVSDGTGCGLVYSGHGHGGPNKDEHTIYACLDKNGDGDYDDAGERSGGLRWKLEESGGECEGEVSVIHYTISASASSGELISYEMPVHYRDADHVSCPEYKNFNLDIVNCPVGWTCYISVDGSTKNDPYYASIYKNQKINTNLNVISPSNAQGTYTIEISLIEDGQYKSAIYRYYDARCSGNCFATSLPETQPNEIATSPAGISSDASAVQSPNELEEACNGCKLDGTCYPIGYRKVGEYCDADGAFHTQKTEGVCENNFECSSNLCSGECVESGLIQKILSWFRNLFS